jgi:hypothetical protein
MVVSMSDAPGNDDSKGPDIVGNITKVADAKLTTLLFGRSVKAAGDFLGEHVEGYFKRRKEEAQRDNVEAHVSRVVEVIGQPLDVKATQYVKVERWVRIAADVPIEDAERSALLEAALADLISTDGTSEYQEVAEKLTSTTARLLLNAPTRDGIAPAGSDQRGFERLKTLGLARTLGLGQVLAITGAWLVGTVVGLIALFRVMPRYFPKLLAIEFVAEAVAISLVLLVFALFIMPANYRLTEFGKAVQQSARRFYQGGKRLRGASIIPKSPWIWGLCGAVLACLLPPLLELYLPALLRTTGRPTVVISSPSVNPSSPGISPNNSAPTSPPDQVMLSNDELGGLVEFWDSVKDQMKGLTELTGEGQSLLETWPQDVEKNRDGFVSRLVSTRNSINTRRNSLTALMNIYRKYPNVDPILRDVSGDGVFNSAYLAFDSFANETQTVPLPPKNFEERLKPYASGLRTALAAMTKWANATGNFATLQSRELSKVEVK